MNKNFYILLYILIFNVCNSNAQQWVNYTTSNSAIAGNRVKSVVVDSHENKWFNTGSIVSKFDGSQWTSSNTHSSIISIAIDSAGNQWYGTDGYGVIHNDYDYYNGSNGLIDNYVDAIAIDAQKNKWFGTRSGIIKLNPSNYIWTTYNTANGLANNNVLSVAIDHHGYIWAGTGSGVSKFDGTSWTTYPYLANAVVKSIAEDKQGNMWFAIMYVGVAKFDGSNWTIYNSTSGLISTDVLAIAIDTLGNKWFATNSGVSEFDGAYVWKNYTTADGLINDYVNDIAVDKQNNIWFGTNGGVSKLTVDPCLSFNASIQSNENYLYYNGDSILINASSGESYKWNNGDTTQNIFAKQSGNYNVIITSINGCIDTSNTISVTIHNSCDSISAGIVSQSICHVGTVLKGTGAHYYNWAPDSNLNLNVGDSIVAYPTVPTTYTLIASSGICVDTTMITIQPPVDPLCQPPVVQKIQKALVTEVAAEWCIPCGTWGSSIFDQLISDNEQKSILMQLYYDPSDDLYSQAAEVLMDYYLEQTFVIPSFHVNGKLMNPYTTAPAKNAVDSTYATIPVANAGYTWTLSGDSLIVPWKVKFFSADSADYYLGMYIVENDVIAYQNGVGNNALHKRVLRRAFGSIYQTIKITNGKVAAGSEFTNTFSVKLDSTWNQTNITIAAILWKLGSPRMKFVNAYMDSSFIPLTTGLNETEYLDKNNSFDIFPNPNSGVFEIKIKAEELKNTSIKITDLYGREVYSDNTLTKQINISNYANGVYNVTLNINGNLFRKKVVLSK